MTSQDPFCISIHVPRLDAFRVASTRRCQGKESFISKMTVELHGLEVRGQRTLLRWRPTGKKLEPFSQTWFRVVDDEFVVNCEIALAEDCETQDRDLLPDASEEDGSEDAVIDELVTSRSTDLSK